MAAPTSPAATAAPLPPLEPPGVRLGFHGFRVAPHPAVSVNGRIASSESVVLPMITAPPARSRRAVTPSAVAGVGSYPSLPNRVGAPSTSTLSLIATGTPSRGADSPPDRRASAASASARARSPSTSVNAFSLGPRRSIRSR